MIEVYNELVKIVEQGQRAVLATIISASGSTPQRAGAKMVIKEDGSSVGTIGGGGAEHKIMQHVREVLKSGKPQIVKFDLSGKDGKVEMICGGEMEVFMEPILGPETLFLFGAGHLSQAMVSIAKMMGFRIVVIDPRPEYTNPERFPKADVLIVDEFENAFPKLNVDEHSYIIIYTSGHISDEKCLAFALKTNAKYIGMIGSRKKSKEVKERLQAKGVPIEALNAVHSPIGIEIGAVTPEEIAISILAEVIKVKRAIEPGERVCMGTVQ